MNETEVLKKLKALGTAQNRKVYARHGVTGPAFGVSYAMQGRLAKAIKRDHGLALGLWASGNHDARVLATMIADPEQVTAKLLNAWARELDNYVLTDAVSGLAAKSPVARKQMEKWIASKNEWTCSAGWNLFCSLATREGELGDAYVAKQLAAIEKAIHRSKNRVRYAMNNAVISVGMRPGWEKKAVAAAKRIGYVEVDHGETGCRTPDAVTYIPKAAAHARDKAKKKAAKKKAAKKKGKTAPGKPAARKKARKKARA